MRIVAADVVARDVPLARPYAIAGGSWDRAEFVFLSLRSDTGIVGHGLAAPAVEVTGETRDAAHGALERLSRSMLLGHDPDDPELFARVAASQPGPAALAAVDTALCDLSARAAGVPLVDRFGRVHEALPTSVTIGVLPVEPTLAEAEALVARGFTALKIKIGTDVDLDLERLTKLRERFGPQLALRADANQGYDEAAMRCLAAALDRLDLEMIEQPMVPAEDAFLRTLPATVRRRLCADESVHDAAALERLVAAGCPFGIVNVKLQKCGGPRPALALAQRCARHGLEVMWGCNDESVLGIAAALHVALACRATAYLDLDGSFDLAEDPFTGGFALRAGHLDLLPRPGLGAEPVTS